MGAVANVLMLLWLLVCVICVMWWFKRPPPLMRSLPLRTDSLPLAFVLNMPNQKSRRQHVARLLEDIGFNQTRYVTPISSYASLASHTKTNIKLFSEIARLPDAWYLYLSLIHI